jgi:hypothetical protein
VDTITELFSLDPFKYSEQALDKIIEHFRVRRTEYQLTGKATKEVAEPVDLKKLGLL